MRTSGRQFSLLFALGLLAMPAVAAAQSAIAGVVRDTTGAALPGVTVEASSPALIEKVRTAVTDATGQYRIVELRPGTYTVTFTLTGFSTVRREGIELQAAFTAPLSVQMRVGAIEETITVTGETPTVDIQNTQVRQVLTRDVLDALPTGRTWQTIGATLPAIVNVPGFGTSKFDVGGSTTMQTGFITAYGSRNADLVATVDGMNVTSGNGSGGIVGFYLNDGAYQEISYQLSGGAADTQTAGVTVSFIPREGGNRFSGHGITLFSNSDFQSTNITDELRAKNFRVPGGVDKSWDLNYSMGGPIVRDKLWFFGSVRNWAYNEFVPNVFNEDGSQAVNDNLIEGYTGRLTYQVNAQNKFTASYDRLPKWRGHFNLEAGNLEPRATPIQDASFQYIGQAKWTSTPTNKLLIEAGVSPNLYSYTYEYQPGVRVATCTTAAAACAPGTNYGDISKTDLITSRTYNAANSLLLSRFSRAVANSSVTYATGSHNFKAGANYEWGNLVSAADRNGQIVQRYRLGVPDSVQTFNDPTRSDRRAHSFALYAQDSWTLGRLTLNGGLRFSTLYGEVTENTVGGGRFVPLRHFDAIKGLPDWKAVTPRFGAAYDLFGNGKTAIKGSIGRYMDTEWVGFAGRYDPMVSSSDTRTWNDLNRDDIAQENELGPSTNLAFGVRRNRNPDPDIAWPSQRFYNVSVGHELSGGVALSVSYNRRTFHSLSWLDNLATTHADYALVTIPDPRGNGQTLPVYNLSAAKLGLVDELDTTTDRNTRAYNGFDVIINLRLPNGARLQGGTSTGRTRSVVCEVDDPNGLRFCDDTALGIPWDTQFKLTGSYPLPFDIQFSGVFQNIRGAEVPITYSVGRAIIPSLTVATVNVRLNEPGSLFLPRVNQLDFRVARHFKYGSTRISPQMDLYNALNAGTLLSQTNTFGPAFGNPLTILGARLVRLGVQVDF